MKQANKEMMKQIAKKLHPNMPHDKAMAKMKADNLFVHMRNKKNYCVMDKIYELLS